MDTKAPAASFMSSIFVAQNCSSVVKLKQQYELKLGDNSLIAIITHYSYVKFRLSDHYDEISCFVNSLGKFDLYIGKPWLEQHDSKLSFRRKGLTLDSKLRISHCLLIRKSCILNSCLKKNNTTPDSFTQRPEDLPEDIFNPCYHYQH